MTYQNMKDLLSCRVLEHQVITSKYFSSCNTFYLKQFFPCDVSHIWNFLKYPSIYYIAPTFWIMQCTTQILTLCHMLQGNFSWHNTCLHSVIFFFHASSFTLFLSILTSIPYPSLTFWHLQRSLVLWLSIPEHFIGVRCYSLIIFSLWLPIIISFNYLFT